MSTASEMRAPSFAAYGTGAGLVVTAGIAALDPATLRPLHAGFDEQADWVLRRLDAVLAEAGSGRQHLLRVECFLAGRQWFGAWNSCFARHFGASAPARTTLVCELPVEGLLIEIQAVATLAGAAAGTDDRSQPDSDSVS
ncbi:RidA family protein [Streptomyces sp. NPDC002928]|uniref:RidA family protein n=1 Tax=Streptomyces sp. NPDC002928 TaxID=3154440 RepID=UPI0033A80CE1